MYIIMYKYSALKINRKSFPNNIKNPIAPAQRKQSPPFHVIPGLIGNLPKTNPMLPQKQHGGISLYSRRGITLFLPYRLLICFTLVARTCVGQGDAFPCIIVLLGLIIAPFFFVNIRNIVSFHLSAVKNGVGFSPCYTTWIS